MKPIGTAVESAYSFEKVLDMVGMDEGELVPPSDDLRRHQEELSSMSPVETLREAARLMREDADVRWHSVADWLEHEARGVEVHARAFPDSRPEPAALAVAQTFLGMKRPLSPTLPPADSGGGD